MPIAVNTPTIDPLEPRRLFSDGVGSDGTLTITGTTGNDAIYVKSMPTKHVVEVVNNGVIKTYPLASVKVVHVTLDDGNDLLDATATDIPVWCDGGSGNDTLLGGNGNDCLIGGLDEDSIQGNLGDDSLSGNGGKDKLFGGPGADRLDGGVSNDTLDGGSSNDRLIGGDGSDVIYGDGGNDRVYSDGTYPDYIYGGSGTDTAYVDHTDVLASIENAIYE